jgi:diguanylate cyclase (GGDEF)-like protein
VHPRRTQRRDWKWVQALDSWPDNAVAMLAAGALAGVLALDWYTGGYAVNVLYLIPVALTAWRLGPLSGAFWAAASAVSWVVVAAAFRGHDIPYTGWNGTIRLATFLVVAAAVAALRRERDAVRTLAGTDHLTGVHDTASFRELVELELSRALRYNRPFTLAYLDVDGFRTVNAEFGHTAGDQALRIVANTIRENIRSMDSVARLGGDEFALLFPETGQGAAEIALRKIQSRLVSATGERTLALTFTVGGVICVGAPESVDELIHRAEDLMYEAKKRGGGAIRTAVLDENFGIQAILQRS